MKMSKKYPRKQIEKFSTIFMQIGLVLVLFVVFLSLEHETEYKQDSLANIGEDFSEIPFTFDRPVIVVKKVEKTKEAKKLQKKQKTNLHNLKKVNNDTDITTIIDLPKDNKIQSIDINKLIEAREDNIDTNEDPKPIFIRNVQKAPVFKGCEGLSEVENRKCFELKIQKHVQRYFDVNLAQDLGLKSGKYRITTQFIIDKKGTVSEIQIRAPHKVLEKEANKVVVKLPEFKPGMQNEKPVKVRYTLPITFKVD